MKDLAQLALDEAVAAGAGYADARAVLEEGESLSVQDDRVEGVERSATRGVGVRVLVDGSWGFAGTARLDREQILAAARRAVAIAKASATAQRRAVRLAPVQVATGSYTTPHATDPFDVGIDDKLELLLAAAAAAHGEPKLSLAKASFDAWRTTKWFVSSEGADLQQTLLQLAGGVECIAVGDGEVQVRSYPNSFRGYCATGGWEDIVALDLVAQAQQHAEQAVALLDAPYLPPQTGTLVLNANQVALQIHESVGHPLELDRILGYEAAYAGTSWVGIGDVGSLRYGSDQVNLTVDTTTDKGLGTYGWDDEGVPAGRHPLVVEGILRDFLTSRETAPHVDDQTRSNGTMRADSWGTIPLIRMTNINLEPGSGSLEQLLDEAGDGVYMSTNKSWSIDDKRLNFQFGCEVAYDIRGGKLGQMYRNPTYTGRTSVFWGSCDGIAGPQHWQVYGTPNCGKGEPGQVARVSHGAAPARFRDVQMGVR